MSDLEDELRGLFRDKEQQALEPRSVSEYVNGADRTVPRRPRRWQWLAVPAAVMVSAAVVVGVAALSNQSGTPAPVVADSPSPSPSATQGHGPLASSAAVSCVKEYSPREVAQRSFAFDGVVTEIGPGTTNREGGGQLRLSSVTFAVNEWFSGGSTETVTVQMLPPTPDGMSAETGQSYDVGSRLLVSGEPRWGDPDPLTDAIASDTCGFTRYWDPETADAWRTSVDDRVDSLRPAPCWDTGLNSGVPDYAAPRPVDDTSPIELAARFVEGTSLSKQYPKSQLVIGTMVAKTHSSSCLWTTIRSLASSRTATASTAGKPPCLSTADRHRAGSSWRMRTRRSQVR